MSNPVLKFKKKKDTPTEAENQPDTTKTKRSDDSEKADDQKEIKPSNIKPSNKLIEKLNLKRKKAPTSATDQTSQPSTDPARSSQSKGESDNISFDLGMDLKSLLKTHFDSELMVGMNPNTHELEFRIGEYRKTNRQTGKSQVSFDAYVPRLNFNRMIKWYHERYQSIKMEENINLDVIFDQNFRVTIGNDNLQSSKSEIEFFCRTNKLRKPTFMEKIQVQKTDNPDWSYRVTSSQESPITNQTQQLKLIGAVEDFKTTI
jgi:hypothetical protein